MHILLYPVKGFLLTLVFFGVMTNARSQCTNVNTVFGAGEHVTYNAVYNWGFIWLNAGVVTFSVDSVLWQNQPAYHLKSIGVTHKAYDRLFLVRDTFETFVERESLRPLEFRRITNEGTYSSMHHYLFNSNNQTIRARISKEGGPVKHSMLPWPECSYDILSMIYQARNIDFSKYKVNDKIPIIMVVDGEIHHLHIRYLGKEVMANRDGRKFRCLKFAPLLVKGTIFEAGEDMTVWVTDDKNRVPIVVEAKILIGAVKAVFVEAEGLRHPFASEIK
jgi:hypothetical protein